MPSDLDAPNDPHSFVAECFSLLQNLQNADGGWAFHLGGGSRVEATCWAICALLPSTESSHRDLISKGFAYLQQQQRSDRSWPAAPEMPSGSWITGLACSVLCNALNASQAVRSGLDWLCDDFPRDSSPFHRFVQSIRGRPKLAEQSDAFRGWGWTPRTSSWVEPTSFAIMAFDDYRRANSAAAFPPAFDKRRASAISLLYDRMCPAGGWNCGNPRVYGVDGEALVLPTCWALLAIRSEQERAERSKSIRWLQNAFPQIQSAASYAIASLTLAEYGLDRPAVKPPTAALIPAELAEQSIHSLAWSCMESDPLRIWPSPTSATKTALADSSSQNIAGRDGVRLEGPRP
jgi:hypothetical protein